LSGVRRCVTNRAAARDERVEEGGEPELEGWCRGGWRPFRRPGWRRSRWPFACARARIDGSDGAGSFQDRPDLRVALPSAGRHTQVDHWNPAAASPIQPKIANSARLTARCGRRTRQDGDHGAVTLVLPSPRHLLPAIRHGPAGPKDHHRDLGTAVLGWGDLWPDLGLWETSPRRSPLPVQQHRSPRPGPLARLLGTVETTGTWLKVE